MPMIVVDLWVTENTETNTNVKVKFEMWRGGKKQTNESYRSLPNDSIEEKEIYIYL